MNPLTLNPFQWLTLTGLAVLLLRDFVRMRAGLRTRRSWAARTTILLAAAAAIARPSLTEEIATALGIGRGTDVVLYVFVLALIGESFYFYSRYAELQREVTELMRHVSLAEARRGGAAPTGAADD